MKIRIIKWSIAFILGLLGASYVLNYFKFHQPKQFDTNIILGVWATEYVNHHIFYYESPNRPYTSLLDEGYEKITFNENGTYIQTFQSDNFDYQSVPLSWEFIEDGSPDSPKLIMYGMKYFPGG